MVWILKEKEITAVMKLDGPARYRHFIKKVADEEQLWGLWQDGWAIAAGNDGCEAMPVWPHTHYAALCANADWANYQPVSIKLDEWMQRWLPGLQKDRRQIAVFPTHEGRGIIVDSQRLLLDLRTELEHYE